MLDLAVTARDDGRARVTLPLSSLAPSTYVLRIEAESGGDTVQQRTAFQIVP